jgi:hypothetical protein
MRTHTIPQAISALAFTGLLLSGGSDPQAVSGERALLNRSTDAASPAFVTAGEAAAIDPVRALLGQTTISRALGTVTIRWTDSPVRTGAESALLGRAGGR